MCVGVAMLFVASHQHTGDNGHIGGHIYRCGAWTAISLLQTSMLHIGCALGSNLLYTCMAQSLCTDNANPIVPTKWGPQLNNHSCETATHKEHMIKKTCITPSTGTGEDD